MTFYDEVGGAETFAALVHHFYAGVADDEPLRALYPEEDLGPAERRLRMFLEQYFGGRPPTRRSAATRSLRMRHVPYAVTLDQRDRWLRHMVGALETVIVEGAPIDEAHADAMKDYFARRRLARQLPRLTPELNSQPTTPIPVGPGEICPHRNSTRSRPHPYLSLRARSVRGAFGDVRGIRKSGAGDRRTYPPTWSTRPTRPTARGGGTR